jgi:hypothetical protein
VKDTQPIVIPATAGIQLPTGSTVAKLDPRLRGDDGLGLDDEIDFN